MLQHVKNWNASAPVAELHQGEGLFKHSDARHSESDLSPLVMEKNSELATPSSKKKVSH